LRPSSPEIAQIAARAVRAAGAQPVRLGPLPTPALALAAQAQGAGAIMVTGSHIPADRNGLKFYRRGGSEIDKPDEAAIVTAARTPAPVLGEGVEIDRAAAARALTGYRARYLDAFGAGALRGLRLGLYTHSSVARDLLAEILRAFGAEVTELGRATTFVPVDTEAVDPATRARLKAWAAQGLDAILSTDGDADRPLLADKTGEVIRGDLLGAITARHLGATHVVTPVTSTTALDAMGFAQVRRTRVGSPYVIAGMADVAPARVVGFEANGGVLLGFDAGPLPALPTRDAVLPLIAPLLAARGAPLSTLVAALPRRVALADRLQGIDRTRAAAWIKTLTQDDRARAAFWDGAPAALDVTDGPRMTHASGDILHLRLSGNAPELRVYAEAEDPELAQALLDKGLALARAEVV
ncbi:phosphomannomutase, partial [Salipiger sp. IMCC34102]|uniref:phosphomannomutase n=1 Tax=Salipiger sp. IMCC34102 TaxID=2510647 RepID=UPI00101D3458